MTTPTSPYRTEIDVLRERKETLEREIAGVRARAWELDALRAHEAALASELAQIDARLRAGGGRKRALPMLDEVRVASPCTADWNAMVGDDRVRFCRSCEKNVYNLSAMPREEAEALLAERLEGELCVRFYQRADGTILTEDCPVGAKKKRRRVLAAAVAGAGAMVAAAATALTRPSAQANELEPRVVARSFHVEAAPTPPPQPTVHVRMGGVGRRLPTLPADDVHEVKGKRVRVR